LSCLFGGVALALYLALGQGTLYGDALTFLEQLRAGDLRYERHVAYLPVVWLAHAVLQPLGYTLYQSALFTSQLGGALAVLLLHCAARGLGLSRLTACLVAVGFALCPATVFFATVVELHGPFLGAMALAWWVGAWLVVRPSCAAAAATGVATAFATAMHSSGALLPIPVLGAFVGAAWPRAAPIAWQRRITLAVVAGAVHAALVLLATGGVQQFGFVAKMAPISAGMEGRVGPVLAWEWLLPFAPYSLLFLAALRTRAARALAFVVLLSLPAYLLPSYLVLGVWREYGAYLLPVGVLAIAATVAVVPRAASLAALALSGGLAVAHVVRRDEPARPREYAAGVRELAGGRRVIVLGGAEVDLEAHYIAMPDVQVVMLTMPPFVDAREPAAAAALCQHIDAVLQEDGVVLLSAHAESTLRDSAVIRLFPPLGAYWPRLSARFDLVAVRARGFAGRAVRARS
jgi:hypothetical protein